MTNLMLLTGNRKYLADSTYFTMPANQVWNKEPGNNDMTANSDNIKEVAYHELTHAAHFNKVGNAWWATLVSAEVNEMIFSGNSPYGNGTNGSISNIIGLAESWAYHLGHFLTDRKYGMNSAPTFFQNKWFFNNNPINGLSSHLNLLEAFDPNQSDDADRWIPTGLYYDLIDDRNEVNAPITDLVSGYTNSQFFNALASDIQSIPAFNTRFQQQVGASSSITALFNQYNY